MPEGATASARYVEAVASTGWGQGPPEPDLSLRHLEAELARIDVLLRRQVRRWQLAGQDSADAYRGLYVSDDQANALLARPVARHWGNGVTLGRDEEAAFTEAHTRATVQASALASAARAQGHPVRLDHLREVFSLGRFEMQVLLICLAPCVDLRYERIYGYLQDDVTRRRPSVNLVLDLLCEPGLERLSLLSHFADDAPLFRNLLLERAVSSDRTNEPLLSKTVVVDETLVGWLLGHYRPDAALAGRASLSRPQETARGVLLAGGHARLRPLRESLVPPSESTELPIVVLHGEDAVGQEAAARLLAAWQRRPMLRVDLDGIGDGEANAERAVRLALRDALLTEAVPCLTGWDACIESDDYAPPPRLLSALCAHPGLVVVIGRKTWRAKGIQRARQLAWLEYGIPPYQQRRALWLHFLRSDRLTAAGAARPDAAAGDDGECDGQIDDVDAIAGQFRLTTGQIRDAVASARDKAAQRKVPVGLADLFAAARASSNPRLSALARKIRPRYAWDDIVLPDDQISLLGELVATVRGRQQVLEEWAVGQKLVSSRGVTALFSGPPGTGKTMAAEIIAGELGLDLYKIDLSTIVSKYIGETEKNLERVFAEAERSNAILFFDEADALFGKRSEVRDSHDRYANIEISYLLQRMEAYDGVTILATNLRANLDEAFTRRLQFAVDFPFPEEADRLRIWQTLLPAGVPRSPQLDFGLLASRFRLSGGSIRNILVSAAYLAAADGQRLTMAHLFHGARRELQKMGRLVEDGDLAWR